MARWIIGLVAALALLLPGSAVADPGKTISSMQSSHSPQWRGLVAACDPELSAYVRTFFKPQGYGTFEEARYERARMDAGIVESFNDVAGLRTKLAVPGSIAGGEGGVLVRCYIRARIAQLSGTGSKRPSVAARPLSPIRPAPAAKLPPARPAKMQAWSPNAMPTDPKQLLSPKFAAERADALASCSGPLQQAATQDRVPTAQASLRWEGYLDDAFMTESAQELRQNASNLERKIAAGDKWAAAFRIGLCLIQRRLAQLEGSPLASGAVDGTLNPLSIGNPGAQWKQQGKDARIIASDGKSAMDCVKLEQLTSGDSKLGGGGRVLVNRCSDEVEIGWCYSPGDCDTETGSGWTVQPGKSWPVKATGEVRWAACHGRDTASFVQGSRGLRYYCKAPAKK